MTARLAALLFALIAVAMLAGGCLPGWRAVDFAMAVIK